MKHLKQKLMAAVAMLLVSSVMLTSASFAWFSISTAPEVTNITTTVTANENLEIALGTNLTTAPSTTTYQDGRAVTGEYTQRKKDQTWGANVLSLQGNTGLGPVVVNSNALQTVTYGTDGRPSGYVNVTDGTMTDGVRTFTDANGNVIGQTVLLWLRTNVANAPVVATVSGITATNGFDTAKVRVTFERCTWDAESSTLTRGTELKVTDSTTQTADLGTLPANTEVPVLMHIYLDGETLANADIATAETVTIGMVKFSSTAVGTPTYTPTTPARQ